ncbi:hypothetical protein A7X81_04725 [Campylobacter ornithocola]|uniref:Uncharacterized protein n=1 Tax=Campylobacter ornithocola TaxID=1848766 RepID=A0AA91FS32_9BACT|nr:hypothetical protein [Campylobacter ornithocola]OCX42603.1 hypothetical protein A7X81_04725 [Campylobacter ornithocola]
MSDINTSKDESLSSIETSKDSALRSIEEAKTQGIASIDEKITQIDFNGIKERVEKNESDIAGINEKLEKAVTTDKDNSFSGNNSFEKPISIPEATKENEGINLGQADGRYAKLLTEKLEWTVGSGGNYSKLSEALIEASKYNPLNYRIAMTLKRGYKLSEALTVYNLYNVTITAEDTEVLVDDSNLVDENYIFTLIDSHVIIDFSSKYSGSKKINFLTPINSYIFISQNKGVSGFYRAITSGAGSYVTAVKTYVENCGYWGYYANKGSLNINGSTLKNINKTCQFILYGGYGATIEANGLTFENISAENTCQCTGAKILLGRPVFKNISNVSTMFKCLGSGEIYYEGLERVAGITNLANIPLNTLTPDGIFNRKE